MNTVLEVLRAADARLADEGEEYDFANWTACTCGHIYAAANGGARADDRRPVCAPQVHGSRLTADLYEQALSAVAEANSHTAYMTKGNAARFAVTNATLALARDVAGADYGGAGYRNAARALVLNAIWMLEDRYERQRLDVLAQTRQIVDGASRELQPA